MAGAATGRVYYGDFRLWREALDAPAERWERTVLQEFQGVDQAQVLVIAASANTGMDLEARCLGFPNPSSKNRKGWLAIKRGLRAGLYSRVLRADPVVWIEDDSLSKTVTGYAAPTITSNGHGRSNGDVVLVRRAGVGLWSLATVGGVTANTFTVTAVTGTSLHAIGAADEIHLVEAYWLGMVLRGFMPQGEEGWYAKEVVYGFRGGGNATSYARTSASVGS